LLGSLLLFRLFFNPLNKFPGPFWARISSLHLSIKVGRKFNAHTYLQQLHEKYGRVVRIGPNDLSITDADAVQIVSSARSKCTKAIWYAQSDPITSLHVTRSPAEHTQRRRIWSQAFSDAALRGYETRVQKYNDLLIQALKDSNGELVVVFFRSPLTFC
jgi:tryprostatin B 6-hydroxylase